MGSGCLGRRIDRWSDHLGSRCIPRRSLDWPRSWALDADIRMRDWRLDRCQLQRGLLQGNCRGTTVSIMVIRNTIGFGISYAITPWWQTQGLQNCFITAGMISIACTFTLFGMIVYGKRLRRWSVPAYEKYSTTALVA